MSNFDAFRVPWTTHFLSGLVSGFPGLWTWLGNLESTLLADQLESIRIDRPLFLAGLARSGSTILLEALAAHADVTSHKYRDFPFVHTPYFWEGGQKRAKGRHAEQPQQRAHADRLLVTRDSPEAMEEMLWMAFFPDAHNPQTSNVLDGEVSCPEFEKYFREHLRKLLLARGGSRYASKGNYNVTRLRYLLQLFPDARFVIPIRSPVDHIASLVKQHRLFCAAESLHPRALAHMQRVGHFEFGIDLRPINAGCAATVNEIRELWRGNQQARGWGRYWASIYGLLARQLAEDEALRQATLVIRYEQLCSEPATLLRRMCDHCELDGTQVVGSFADKIGAPNYYQPDFSVEDVAAILEETHEVAASFEYDLVESLCGV